MEPEDLPEAKLRYQWNLGSDWMDLATALDISQRSIRRFAPGDEARHIWDWLACRNRLHDLPPALNRIGRGDLGTGLVTALRSPRLVQGGAAGPAIWQQHRQKRRTVRFILLAALGAALFGVAGAVTVIAGDLVARSPDSEPRPSPSRTWDGVIRVTFDMGAEVGRCVQLDVLAPPIEGRAMWATYHSDQNRHYVARLTNIEGERWRLKATFGGSAQQRNATWYVDFFFASPELEHDLTRLPPQPNGDPGYLADVPTAAEFLRHSTVTRRASQGEAPCPTLHPRPRRTGEWSS